MNRLLITGLTILATITPALPTTAQRKVPFCPFSKKEIPVKIVNERTIVCRDVDPGEGILGRTKAIDVVSLYEWNGSKKGLASSASVTVYPFGSRLATVAEFKQEYCSKPSQSPCSKLTQFLLRNRQFDEWVNDAEPELLERQRPNLTLLLDTLEQNPRIRPSF